jgi:hypothetical protein
MTAKTRATSSSQPGQIPSKVPRFVAGLLRQVTLTKLYRRTVIGKILEGR